MAVSIALAVWFLVPAASVRATSAVKGGVFEPPPLRPELYGIKAPGEDVSSRETQQHVLVNPGDPLDPLDDVEIWLETWLPAPSGLNVPPARLPSVLMMTPYAAKGHLWTRPQREMETLVKRGYAFTQMHIRGTGESGGCIELFGPNEMADAALAIEYLGRDAPWASGVVGTIDLSSAGISQIGVAGLEDAGAKHKTRYLKAMVVGAAVPAYYDYANFDGVPVVGFHAYDAAYHQQYSLTPHVIPEDVVAGTEPKYYLDHRLNPDNLHEPSHLVQKPGCWSEAFAEEADRSGDVNAYFAARDFRPRVGHVTAATLITHGFNDTLRPAEDGWFEQLPATTPKAGVFGFFGHEFPDSFDASNLRREWERADWPAMYVGWFDRWLRGDRNNVDSWPVAQVQGTDGLWREEPEWPTTGGPVGHLALGPARTPGAPSGTVGASAPTGSTTYVEGGYDAENPLPGTRAVFVSEPLPDRLEITGQPVLDLWVRLSNPAGIGDAHVSARVEALDANGNPLDAADDWKWSSLGGARSAQHLEPLVANSFQQSTPVSAPLSPTRLNVPVRMPPADLVVPKGGRVRVTVAGMLPDAYGKHPWPSFAGTTVEVLHDCASPDQVSALRFLMPRHNARLLNVREKTEGDARLRPPGPARVSDGGGIAAQRVCGRAPFPLPHSHVKVDGP